MLDRHVATAALLIAVYIVLTVGVAHADPELIECPDHTHVWNSQQCSHSGGGGGGSFGGLPGTGGGGPQGGGGLLGVVRRALGGLL